MQGLACMLAGWHYHEEDQEKGMSRYDDSFYS